MLFSYETDRLLLKILKPSDASKVLNFYLRDKELFETYEPDRMDQFYTEKFQQTSLRFEYNAAIKMESIRFYVFLKEAPDTIIGTVCIHNIARINYGSCEIGYKFSSAVHHKGYATEALCRILNIIFHELTLHRVMAWVYPDNVASRRLLTRLGFFQDGLCRDYLYLHGEWRDHFQYSLLSTDWTPAPNSVR